MTALQIQLINLFSSQVYKAAKQQAQAGKFRQPFKYINGVGNLIREFKALSYQHQLKVDYIASLTAQEKIDLCTALIK